jgi:rod shape-determining protein MreD
MKTRSRFLPVCRAAVCVLLFVLTAVFQNTFLSGLPVGLLPLAPLTVAVCTFEGEFAGLFYGILSGALYDIASPVPDGVYTLVFAVLGCAVGLCMHYLFRNTLLSAMLITLIFTAVAVGVGFVFNVIVKDAAGAAAVLRQRAIPGVLLTTLLTPVFYYPVRAADGKLR